MSRRYGLPLLFFIAQFFVAQIFISTVFSSPLSATPIEALEENIQSDLAIHNYARVALYLDQALQEGTHLARLEKFAKKIASPNLFHAVAATRHIDRSIKKLGLSKRKYLQLAFAVETLHQKPPRKSYYLSKGRSKLPCDIQYDHETKKLFFVLKSKKSYLGKGAKKEVHKAVLYDRKHPKIVARLEEDGVWDRELEITQMLNGHPGIMKSITFMIYRKNGKKRSVIYSKLYGEGSIERFCKSGQKLSFYELLKVSVDLLSGLESMHKFSIVHRDLGARNYLLDIPKPDNPKGDPGRRKVQACVADLGRAQFVSHVEDTKVQGNTTYTAPEALYRDRLRAIDYYQADVFAVGCVLYRLFHGQKCPWQDISYVKDRERPLDVRYNELVARVRAATESRRAFLEEKRASIPLTDEESYEQLFLKMLSLDPNARESAQANRIKLQALFERQG